MLFGHISSWIIRLSNLPTVPSWKFCVIFRTTATKFIILFINCEISLFSCLFVLSCHRVLWLRFVCAIEFLMVYLRRVSRAPYAYIHRAYRHFAFGIWNVRGSVEGWRTYTSRQPVLMEQIWYWIFTFMSYIHFCIHPPKSGFSSEYGWWRTGGGTARACCYMWKVYLSLFGGRWW